MAIDFKLPELGENITSGDVVNVLVKEGDQIEANQGVVELETDKAVIEVPGAACGQGHQGPRAEEADGRGRPAADFDRDGRESARRSRRRKRRDAEGRREEAEKVEEKPKEKAEPAKAEQEQSEESLKPVRGAD